MAINFVDVAGRAKKFNLLINFVDVRGVTEEKYLLRSIVLERWTNQALLNYYA